jgi:Lon protease-like protein
MTQKLPIFPLNTVLFPGAPIQLHIFEERYRLMVARCLEQHAPFGVVLIRSGSEVSPDDPWVREQVERAGGGDEELSALRQQLGGETVPYAVGTSAQISTGESTRLPDGRYYLVAMGQKRFRIQYLTQRRPYMVASVAYLPDSASLDGVVLAGELRTLYERYWLALGAAMGEERPSETLPDGVVELTYWMANRLHVDNARKQRWLEADADTRLREITAALRNELSMLPGGGFLN